MRGGCDVRVTSRCGQKAAYGGDPWWIKTALLVVAISFLFIFLLIPLITVFVSALQKGLGPYFATFSDPAAFAAIQLTLMVAAIAVPANLIFGVSAAWAMAKFDFPGKSLLITLIDLPFAVSPVVSGTDYRLHLLNVPAGKLGAYPEKPRHFLEWLKERRDLVSLYCPKSYGCDPHRFGSICNWRLFFGRRGLEPDTHESRSGNRPKLNSYEVVLVYPNA